MSLVIVLNVFLSTLAFSSSPETLFSYVNIFLFRITNVFLQHFQRFIVTVGYFYATVLVHHLKRLFVNFIVYYRTKRLFFGPQWNVLTSFFSSFNVLLSRQTYFCDDLGVIKQRLKRLSYQL